MASQQQPDEEGVGGSVPPPRTPPSEHGHARRRSRHIYAAVVVGLCVLLVWAISRLSLCWGDYGAAGTLLCHSQWATFLAFLAGTVALWLLVIDLAEPHLSRFTGRMRRSRAAWYGYRQLGGRALFHTTASTLLLLVCVLGFLWLVLFGPARF